MASTTVSGDLRLLTLSSASKIPRKTCSSSLSFLTNKDLLNYYTRAKIVSSSLSNSQRFALGKESPQDGFLSNVSEDSDEMFDDLFNKYGKVVYKSDDQKSAVAEVDDDAESLAFAVEMARVASDVKAADIKLLFVKPLVYWTRFFIIATAFSRPQINAIQSKMRDMAEDKYGKVANGDVKPNAWTLLDFGDMVIHIFLPPQRTFYNLEDFYGNAMSIPFEDQPPPPPKQ